MAPLLYIINFSKLRSRVRNETTLISAKNRVDLSSTEVRRYITGWPRFFGPPYRSGTDGRCCIDAGRHSVFTHQVAALFYVKWRHDRHLEIMTSSRKSDSVNGCVFTWGTIQVPNIIPIRFETTEHFEDVGPNKKNKNENKVSCDIYEHCLKDRGREIIASAVQIVK